MQAPQDFISTYDVYLWAVFNKPDRSLKIKDFPVFFNQDYTTIDVALNVKGPQEDAELLGNDRLRCNIRRGNTLISKFCEPSESEYKIKPKGSNLTRGIQVEWCRKGFQKFFDIRQEYLDQSQTEFLETDGSFIGNFRISGGKKGDEKIRLIIFQQAEQTILDGHRVKIYKTRKANGENAQISFFAPLNCWVIASKNVSLTARDAKDLKGYVDSRYFFAVKIAKVWFQKLGKMSIQQLNQLKTDLAGYTIVGEYVGDQDHQHLISYSSINLLFYSLVKNDSNITCEPPIVAFSFFKRYGLDCVPVEILGSFSDLRVFYQTLLELFSRVASESVDEGEEGCVLYFTAETDPDNPVLERAERHLFYNEAKQYDDGEFFDCARTMSTLSLAKLKTLEYRVFRKLREKLKNFGKHGNVDRVFRTYVTEVEQLVKNEKLPQDKEYYYEIARRAFEKALQHPNAAKKAKSHYLDFLFDIMGKDRRLDKPAEGGPNMKVEGGQGKSVMLVTPPLYFSEGDIVDFQEQLQLPVVEYSWNEINRRVTGSALYLLHISPNVSMNFRQDTIIVIAGFNDLGVENSAINVEQAIKTNQPVSQGVFSFTQTKDIRERIATLWSKVENLKRFLTANFPQVTFISEYEPVPELIDIIKKLRMGQMHRRNSNIEKHVHFAEEPTEIPLYVIIPLGIPAMGKSSLIPALERVLPGFNKGLDVISSDKIRGDLMTEFMANNRKANKEKAFDKTGTKAKNEFYRQVRGKIQSSLDSRVIFLDKNHPPNAISSTLRQIKDSALPGFQVKIIGLVPECGESFQYEENGRQHIYPFSAEFLLNCCVRVRDRAQHETLEGTLSKRVSIVLMMFHIFRGTDFQDYLNSDFDYLLEIPFTSLDYTNRLPDLSTELADTLRRFKPGQTPKANLIQQFVDIIQSLPPDTTHVQHEQALAQKLSEIFGRPSGNPSTAPPIEIDHHPIEPHYYQQLSAVPLPAQPSRPVFQVPAESQKRTQSSGKAPLFLGIDLEESLGCHLLFLVKNALTAFQRKFADPEIEADLADLFPSQHMVHLPYQGGTFVSGGWKFTNSLHLTTLFMGGRKDAQRDPIFQQFTEGSRITLELLHIAYSPQKIICANARILTPDIGCANKIPHVTLLLSQWQAKNSNDLLQSLAFLPDGCIRHTVRVLGQNISAYTLQLSPSIVLEGVYLKY